MKIEVNQNKSFEEVVKELQDLQETKDYKNDLVRKTLGEKPNLRKIFSVVIIQNPARFNEIQEKIFLGRMTIYSHLYKLIELGVIKQISIMSLWNRSDLNEEEAKILNKFKEWTKNMTDRQLHYFAAKTNYFCLSEFGKDLNIINWTLRLSKNEKND